MQHWSTPAAPPRTSSGRPEANKRWKEPIGTLVAVLLSAAVLFSVLCLFVYARRESLLYDEVTDYLEKTVSISKINYNPVLGLYEVKPKDESTLGDSRRYKTLIYLFLFCDAATLFFLGIAIMLYYSSDVDKGTLHVLFWVFFGVGCVYSVAESASFATLIFPYSARLPNGTEALLDRAVPHNPGGLMQMEDRLGCTFDQNLYETFHRKLNPKNTCDPTVMKSYISQALLLTIVLLRVVVLMLFGFLLACRRFLGEPLATLIGRTKPPGGYQAKYIRNKKASGKRDHLHTPKDSTTFGTGKLYNNAAYFAVSNSALGMPGNMSSRSSDLDAADLYKAGGSIHTQNSLVSEV